MTHTRRVTMWVEPDFLTRIDAAISDAGLRYFVTLRPEKLGVVPNDWAMGGTLRLFSFLMPPDGWPCDPGAIIEAIRSRIGFPVPA